MINFEIMNRETKFRVWDIAKQKYLPTDCYALVITDFGAFGVMINNYEDYRTGEYLYPDAQVVEFFTGLKDKNGVDIYEGDVLRMENVYGEIRAVVSFKQGKFVYTQKYVDREKSFLTTDGCTYDLCFKVKPYLVIGNIHENPELLTN